LCLCFHAHAQTIKVHLLNGKTGKPMGKKNVLISWQNDLKTSEVSINEHGLGEFSVVEGGHEFIMMSGDRKGKEPFRIPYLNCNESPQAVIKVERVLKTGFVPVDKCGHRSTKPRPGELIFWAQPKPWWQPDFQ
jgi:hypothetical protein